MPDPFTAAAVTFPLAIYAIVEVVAWVNPDWPANCTPFVGAAQRWKQSRENPEPEFMPEAEHLPAMPANMSDAEFEAWINAPEPRPAPAEVAREMEDGKLLFTPAGPRSPRSEEEWEKFSKR